MHVEDANFAVANASHPLHDAARLLAPMCVGGLCGLMAAKSVYSAGTRELGALFHCSRILACRLLRGMCVCPCANLWHDGCTRVGVQIASFGLDVLVYPDVGMTALSFLLALQRLAPVQVPHSRAGLCQAAPCGE